MKDKIAVKAPQYGLPPETFLLLAEQEKVFSWVQLGERWGVHFKVAARRWKEFGMPVVRFNSRTAGARLSDILRIEAQALEFPSPKEERNGQPGK